MEEGKASIAQIAVSVAKELLPEAKFDEAELSKNIVKTLTKPPPKNGELALGCFVFARLLPKGEAPAKFAAQLGPAIQKRLDSEKSDNIERCEASGPYVNFHLTSTFLAKVIPAINSGDYLSPLPQGHKEKVMIEYSQPNTHKAFHVGHMRNAALGDCLIHLYEQCGHAVVAANYFGDEGAHVAKCLWYLQRILKEKPDFKLEGVDEVTRGEWLGGLYSSAVEQLDLATLTSLPYANIIAAQVVAVDKHPAADAPPNWHVVTLEVANGEKRTVVCGGIGYKLGDKVAYMPLGAKFKGKEVVGQDMKGVKSEGVMMSEKELGIEREEKVAEKPKLSATEAHQQRQDNKKQQAAKKETEATPKKEPAKKSAEPAAAKSKENKGKPTDAASQQIYILPAEIGLGQEATEFGRVSGLDANVKVMDEHNRRKSEVKETLLKMESGESSLSELWAVTKEWSLKEFRTIYKWLNVRFDHEFFESEVSEESRNMVLEYLAKGVLQKDNGAVGADLNKFGLGFCILLKSDGAGLYATKDLALAQRKFSKFGIEKSLYIVDAAQTLHFKQVFKVLELMGYEQAKKCTHLPYGQVVLPSGRMKSRVFGSVILFSQLKETLGKHIYDKQLYKFVTGVEVKPDGTEKEVEKWSVEEVNNAQHLISVAAIKYGMLNHDTAKDIVFVLEDWAATTGNTGPYMLYAYARTKAIEREVKLTGEGKVDFSLLGSETEKAALVGLHEFWSVVESCASKNNPSTLCNYVHEVAKSFSAWYASGQSVVNAETEDLKVTRLEFVRAQGKMIKKCLELLGITVLERM